MSQKCPKVSGHSFFYFIDKCTLEMYILIMERNKDFVYLDMFIWDTEKNEYNKKKHGIDFETGVRIFNDPLLYSEYDYEHSGEEDREKFIGLIDGRLMTTLSGTERNDKLRIISVRAATAREIKIYEENAKKLQDN